MKISRRLWITVIGLLGTLGGVCGAALLLWGSRRYAVEKVTTTPVYELSMAEYPEDPSRRSPHFGQYSNRTVTLEWQDDRRFTLTLKPAQAHAHVATITIPKVDAGLLTPALPSPVRGDAALE